MFSFSEFARQIRHSAAALSMTGVLVIFCGCDDYSGPSDYEILKQQQNGFSGVIESAGGTAVKEGKSMFGFEMAGWLIDLSGSKITDDLITKIIEVGEMDPVFQLNFSGTDITNDQLARLDAGKVLQKTVILNLSNTAINDAGLDKLSNFYCISELNLKGSKATKAGAIRLGAKQIGNSNTPAPFKKQPKLNI